MASSSSHSSFSSVSRDDEYEVFLNFMGQDTRRNIVGHLYNALSSRGLRSFIDSEYFAKGEEISPNLVTTIEQSRISIPIFSKNYASSKWCLNELHKILECYERNHQIVLPIFLDVKPSEVQNQTGSFGDGFRKHKDNYEPEIVDAWRNALNKIGKLKGWVLAEVAGGDESELICLVVGKVLGILIDSPLNVARYPIGLDFNINHVMYLLCLKSMDPQFVGICGMGGSGKTTLAKAVYNLLWKRFDGSSFLLNIRERALQSKDLVDLQIQLLNDILGKQNYDIRDASVGSKMIEERLKKKKVLLMLDDVDHFKQLKALAGDLRWFGPGSRIIITTRNELVLKMGIFADNKIYNMDLLDDKQSLQLFSMHAFGEDHPPKDLLQLSRELVSYAGGLPLTLEVLGSLLRGCDEIEWEHTLEKLKCIPYNEVQRKLKTSFDSLNDKEKDIFLDIACFFIGMDKEIASYIWEGCGFNPRMGLNVLIEMCLLRISDDNKLTMHRQLRDLGRQIVHEENPAEPGKRSRLWFHEEIMEVLKLHTGTKNVEAIVPGEFEIQVSFIIQDFTTMSKLRLLQINGVDLKKNIEYLPSSLRWLCWQRCPLKIIPSNFCLEELVVLDLTDSNIIEVWNSALQNKKFENLKVLNLSNCSNLAKSPDFSRFPQLEKLILKGCKALVDIESIGQLKSLIHLDLNECIKLTAKLNIRELPSLQRIIFCNGRKLEKRTLR